MTTVVYSAIVGDRATARTDVSCFGNDEIFQRPVMEAKRYKILPHLFVDADVSIWVDGNISLRVPPQTIIDDMLGDADMALFRHPYRRTVWDEFATLKDDPRFAIPYLQRQLKGQRDAYLVAGLPTDAVPYECNFLVRRNNARVNRLMESWWSQICRWQWRDQVSLPFVLWKCGDVSVSAVSGNIRDHPHFHHVEQWPTVKRG